MHVTKRELAVVIDNHWSGCINAQQMENQSDKGVSIEVNELYR